MPFVNGASGKDYSGTGGTTIATSSPATFSTSAGNLLWLVVRYFEAGSGQSISSVADVGGSTFQLAIRYVNPDQDALEIWYAENCAASGVNVVTVTFSGSVAYRGVCVNQESGIALSGALDQTASGFQAGGLGVTTVTSGSFTTTQADEVIAVGMQIARLGSSWTAGTGYTLRTDDADVVTATEDQTVSTIQTGVTASATASHDNGKSIVVATFKVAAAATGNPWYAYAQQRIRARVPRWLRSAGGILLPTPAYGKAA